MTLCKFESIYPTVWLLLTAGSILLILSQITVTSQLPDLAFNFQLQFPPQIRLWKLTSCRTYDSYSSFDFYDDKKISAVVCPNWRNIDSINCGNKLLHQRQLLDLGKKSLRVDRFIRTFHCTQSLEVRKISLTIDLHDPPLPFHQLLECQKIDLLRNSACETFKTHIYL